MGTIIIAIISSLTIIGFMIMDVNKQVRQRRYDRAVEEYLGYREFRESDIIERNINRLYECTNDKCTSKLIRYYEILEGLKYGIDTGYGKYKYTISKDTEYNYAVSGRVLVESEAYCMNCGEYSIYEVEYFDWMDNIEEPKKISIEEWNYKRDKFDEDKKQAEVMLDELEKKAKGMREISTFQRYYELNKNKEIEKEIRGKREDVVKQLNMVSELSPYLSVRTRAFFMIDGLKWD